MIIDNSRCPICKTEFYNTMQTSQVTGVVQQYEWCQPCHLAFPIKVNVKLTKEDGIIIKSIVGMD